MADDRVVGDIATKLVMENDRVRIWEMRLEPGEESDLHRHDHD
jgi:beta-alanine degradation protein BauB